MHAAIFPNSVFLSVDKKTDDFHEFGRCAGVGFADFHHAACGSLTPLTGWPPSGRGGV